MNASTGCWNGTKADSFKKDNFMKNFIFISPGFPGNYENFCMALRADGVNVLGIGDAPMILSPPDSDTH